MEPMIIRWGKAFAIYFCVVVTLQSIIEFLYAHSFFQMPMLIMGTSIPSAYIYGIVLGLVLSISHFVLGKTIEKGHERIIREHMAANKQKNSTPTLPASKKKTSRRKK